MSLSFLSAETNLEKCSSRVQHFSRFVSALFFCRLFQRCRFILSLFVPHRFFFWFLMKAILRICGLCFLFCMASFCEVKLTINRMEQNRN